MNVKTLDLFTHITDDMIKFDADLHIKQLDEMKRAVERGDLVPQLVVLGNLADGKKINTKKFVERVNDRQKSEARGLFNTRRN